MLILLPRSLLLLLLFSQICIVTILLSSLLLLLLLLLLFSLNYHILSILYYYQLLRINFHVDVSEKRFWCTPDIFIKSLASWKIHGTPTSHGDLRMETGFIWFHVTTVPVLTHFSSMGFPFIGSGSPNPWKKTQDLTVEIMVPIEDGHKIGSTPMVFRHAQIIPL